MNRREILQLLPVAFIPSCTAPPVEPSPPPPSRPAPAPDHGFTAAHLDAAVKLQALSGSRRISRLIDRALAYDATPHHAVAGKPSAGPDPFVLCRMLFVPRQGGTGFRAPMLGVPHYPGGTASADWPLTPVTLVDGAPFKLVSGYMLAGQPEAASDYLTFALSHCDWTTFRYRRLSLTARMASCQSLLRSRVWRRPLQFREHEWFLQQAA